MGRPGGMGAQPDPGAQRREPRAVGPSGRASPFSSFTTVISAPGEPRPPARGAGNRSRIRPMWSAAGVPDPSGLLPTQALAQALQGITRVAG